MAFFESNAAAWHREIGNLLTHKRLESVESNRLSCLIDSFCIFGKLLLKLGHSQGNQIDDQFNSIQQMSVVVDVAAIFSLFQVAKEELITIFVVHGDWFSFFQGIKDFMSRAGNCSIKCNQSLLRHQ